MVVVEGMHPKIHISEIFHYRESCFIPVNLSFTLDVTACFDPLENTAQKWHLAGLNQTVQDATFVRDTTRASKRSNVSYMKPGPPTPGWTMFASYSKIFCS